MSRSKPSDQFSYPPRAMRAERAAAYLDMAKSTFLRLVEEGVLPPPVRIKGVVAWDRLELDSAFDGFKSPDPAAENSMHKLLGIGRS